MSSLYTSSYSTVEIVNFCRYKVDKGKLFHKSKKGIWVEVVLSKSQREQIVKSCHSDPITGHLGMIKTFYKVSKRFYLPGIFGYISQYVRACI